MKKKQPKLQERFVRCRPMIQSLIAQKWFSGFERLEYDYIKKVKELNGFSRSVLAT